MAERIASGEVFIEVNDRDAIARLNEIRREYHSTMQAIDREEANPEIKADLADFRDAVANAKRELKKLEGERAEVRLGIREGSIKEYNAQIKKARAEIKSLDGMTAEVEIEVHGADHAIKEQQRVQKATEARLKAEEKQERQLAALADKLHRENMARVNRESKVRESLNRQRLRELSTAEREARQMEKERNEVPKLEAAYARLQNKLEGLGRARRKARGDDKATFMVDVSTREALSDLERLRHEIRRRVGRDPISMPIELSLGERAGNKVRQEFYKNNGALIPLAAALGADIGTKMGNSASHRFRQVAERGFTRSLGDAVKNAGQSVGRSGLSVLGKFGNALGNLSDATVRLGPFTSSIRGAGLALSVLGPVLVDIVGALGALVGVVGSAAVGLGALGLGASGLILSLGGMVMLTKPLISDFKTLTQLGGAYHKAVLKYGEGSKQAQAAQKQLNEALKGVDPATRKAYEGFDKLRTSWGKYVDKARPEFVKTLSDAFKTANADVDMFGKRSVQAFNTTSKGFQGWLKGLRSAEGRGILDTLMGNANRSIGPLMHGLGNIVTYLGRVAAIASGSIPGLARQFDRWSESIKATSEDSASLAERVQKVVQSAKDVGRFFMSAGRFLKAFFGGGVEAGDNFINTMSNALDRWTAFLNTTDGQNSLKSFFAQSVSGAEALYSALAPIITSFTRWAIQIAPIARAFFEGASAVTGFANSLLRVTALRGPITAIATTLGTLWAVGRISAATRAITGFGAALMGVQRAGAATSGGGMLAGMLGGAGAAGGAKKAAGEVTLLRRAAVLAVPAIGTMGETAAAASTGGLALLAGAAIYGGYKLLTMKSANDKVKESIQKSLAPLKDLAHATVDHSTAVVQAGMAQHDYNTALAHVSAYKEKLNRLERQGKKDTADYRSTLAQLNQALLDRQNAEQQITTANQAAQKSSQKTIDANDKLRATEENLGKAREKVQHYEDQLKRNNSEVTRKHLADATKNLTDAEKAHTEAMRAQQRAAFQSAVDAVNYQRAVKGLIPAAGAAAAALGKLYRRNSQVAAKIAVKYEDPKDAGRVASRANQALKSGVSSKIVTKIIADSSSAEQAMRRLQAQARSLEAKRFAIKLGADDKASSTIAKIVARVNSMPEGRAKVRAIDNATSTIARIVSRVMGIPNKDARLIARDLISGKAQAAMQAIARIPNKTVRLNVAAQLGPLQQAINMLGGLHDKTVTLTTVQNVIKSVKNSRASGRGAIGHERAWVGEGHNWKGATEFIADHRTGAVQAVNGPTVMDLNPYQAVIPTEPRYRAVGQRLWGSFAKQFGMDEKLPRYAGSRKKKKKLPTSLDAPSKNKKYKNVGLSEYGKAQSRKGARSKLKGHQSKSYDSDAILAPLTKAQRAEDTQVREISLAQDNLKEPDSFIKQTGTDVNGDPVYGVDDAAVSSWKGQLDGIAKMFDQLASLIQTVINEASSAMTKFSTIETTAKTNAKTLFGMWQSADRASKKKGGTKAGRQAAKERAGVYKDAFDAEKQTEKDAHGDYVNVEQEHYDAGYRKREAEQSASQFRSDRDAVEGKATADATAANPQPEKPQTPLEAAQAAVTALDTQSALASIGQAVAPTADEVRKANQGVIDAGTAMLHDNNPGNDSEANSAIQTAAGNIAGLNDTAAAAGAASAQQYMASGSARQDLFSNFANNFMSPSSLGSLGGSIGGGFGSGAFGTNASAFGAPTSGGGVNNVFNQVFNTMPDPHTWSQGVAFELQAAL